MATGTTLATPLSDFTFLNEYNIEKYCSIEEGAIIRRPCITQCKRETFQYSIQNKKKKVAVTIQVFVGTKTGWFRGFCSYYVEKVEGEGKICSGKRKGDELAHENFFYISFVLGSTSLHSRKNH